jgi:hypothetical protein
VQIVEGVVARVIVCDSAEWAATTHGGEWVATDTLPGIGWVYMDGEIVPPPDEAGTA